MIQGVQVPIGTIASLLVLDMDKARRIYAIGGVSVATLAARFAVSSTTMSHVLQRKALVNH